MKKNTAFLLAAAAICIAGVSSAAYTMLMDGTLLKPAAEQTNFTEEINIDEPIISENSPTPEVPEAGLGTGPEIIPAEAAGENLGQGPENPISEIGPPDEPIAQKNPYEDAVLVPYGGYVDHIFFHPLIAYNDRAFNGDASSKGMDDYMATALECKRLLEQAYNNGFVLVDINKVYDFVTDENGVTSMARVSFDFPEGKKPMVISMDDVNYYPYMIEDGCNNKLVLDEQGEIANYSEDLSGNPVISYDTEVITIVERFLEEHPDFSFDGARGVIGLTGYEGILGYRTQEGSPTREIEVEAVKPVIEELKSLGWTFASHSYGHPHMSQITLEYFKEDTDDWKREVEPLVGPTRVFLYPYGDFIKHEDAGMEKINYLIDVGGFNIHCGVSVYPYSKSYERYAYEDRKNIDGLTLRNQHEKVKHMFDTEYVIDREARGW
ncbi:MAG: polysaccharide deacetylase family protein [Clostridiales bacterium]|jgi:hypothetical protein|nr:polysaccharide deacetylase family protein [Clostridiales bacterium]